MDGSWLVVALEEIFLLPDVLNSNVNSEFMCYGVINENSWDHGLLTLYCLGTGMHEELLRHEWNDFKIA